MKVYNQDKTQILENYDLDKGRLVADKKFVAHHNAVSERGHWETLKTYSNGGKDVKWVIDVAGQDAYDEYEDIQVYIPYTEKEILSREHNEIKIRLQKYKEDVEQVELFGMERTDYAEKKSACASMILRLREIEKILNAD